MISFASQDTRVQAVGQFLLTEHQDLVNDDTLDAYLDDREALLEEVARYYDLDFEGVREAFVNALTSLGVEKGSNHGEN